MEAVEPKRNASIDSGSNSSTSTEDVEPIFSYFRMKSVVTKILNEDFASCMCVNFRVIIELT
jgi:hypothetical protein